jgi:hypothetical protein
MSKTAVQLYPLFNDSKDIVNCYFNIFLDENDDHYRGCYGFVDRYDAMRTNPVRPLLYRIRVIKKNWYTENND